MKIKGFIEVTDPVENLRRCVNIRAISFVEEAPSEWGTHRSSLCIGNTFEFNDEADFPDGTIFIPCAESYEEILDKMIEVSGQ